MSQQLHDLGRRLMEAINAFDVEAALPFFAPDAVIEDASVGDKFIGLAGIRSYIERYFVGYHTRSRILAANVRDNHHLRLRLDFTGDFGHETGVLDISTDREGLIVMIDASLE